jgi:hypothetical protein
VNENQRTDFEQPDEDEDRDSYDFEDGIAAVTIFLCRLLAFRVGRRDTFLDCVVGRDIEDVVERECSGEDAEHKVADQHHEEEGHHRPIPDNSANEPGSDARSKGI